MPLTAKQPSTKGPAAHLAMSESLDEGQQGPETEWGEHVSDEEYPRP